MCGRSTVARREIPPLLLIAAGLIAYANSFQGAFVLDDIARIVTNKEIRHL